MYETRRKTDQSVSVLPQPSPASSLSLSLSIRFYGVSTAGKRNFDIFSGEAIKI